LIKCKTHVRALLLEKNEGLAAESFSNITEKKGGRVPAGKIRTRNTHQKHDEYTNIDQSAMTCLTEIASKGGKSRRRCAEKLEVILGGGK